MQTAAMAADGERHLAHRELVAARCRLYLPGHARGRAEQGGVVRDEHERPRVRGQEVLDGSRRPEIEVVGGLVHDDELRRFEDSEREHELAHLSGTDDISLKYTIWIRVELRYDGKDAPEPRGRELAYRP